MYLELIVLKFMIIMNIKNGILFRIVSLFINIYKYIGNRKLVVYVNGGCYVVDLLVMWYYFIG